MKKLSLILFVLAMVMLIMPLTAFAASKSKKQVYWIDKSTPVLAFIGNIHSLDLTPVRFSTFKKQKIRLFHKKSGPGVYAFHLPGLVVENLGGKRTTIKSKGYFLVNVKWLLKIDIKRKNL